MQPALTRFADALQSIMITAWAGALWTLGFVVAPTLFTVLDDRVLAGRIAGTLFSFGAWIGLACGTGFVLLCLLRSGAGALRQVTVRIALLLLVLTLTGKFGLQPILAGLREQALSGEIAQALFRQRFGTWHAVSGVLHLFQSGLAVALVVFHRRAPR